MIREVGGGGTRYWGPSRKRVRKFLKEPKSTYTNIAIAEKQSNRSKKGPFCYIFGSPGSHPGIGINETRRGRSLPGPPPPVSPAMHDQSQACLRPATYLPHLPSPGETSRSRSLGWALGHPWRGAAPFKMHHSITFKHQFITGRPPLGNILYPPLPSPTRLQGATYTVGQHQTISTSSQSHGHVDQSET